MSSRRETIPVSFEWEDLFVHLPELYPFHFKLIIPTLNFNVNQFLLDIQIYLYRHRLNRNIREKAELVRDDLQRNLWRNYP